MLYGLAEHVLTLTACRMQTVYWYLHCTVLSNAQNPLHTFPRNFPVDGELVANLLQACYGLVVYLVDMLRT